jgi:hypothetical protein
MLVGLPLPRGWWPCYFILFYFILVVQCAPGARGAAPSKGLLFNLNIRLYYYNFKFNSVYFYGTKTRI